MAKVLLDNEQWEFGTNCFVCEPKNARGLGIPFYVDADAGRVEAVFTPEAHHSGAPMFAHGGFSMALIDEGMAWAVIAIAHRFGVTRETNVQFLRPVKVGAPHTVACWVESHDGQDLVAAGEVRDARGKPCVVARATFTALTKEQVAGAIGGQSAQAEGYARQ
jgi:uncharacterized protein (TIGR00369 family)